MHSSSSIRIQKIQAHYRNGIKGDRHSGTRLLDIRERGLLKHGLPKGVEIANFRQFSPTSTEELADIQAKLHLPSNRRFFYQYDRYLDETSCYLLESHIGQLVRPPQKKVSHATNLPLDPLPHCLDVG